jgi:hypothetical protein
MSTYDEKKRHLGQMKDCELAAVWTIYIHNPILGRFRVRFMTIVEEDYKEQLKLLEAEEVAAKIEAKKEQEAAQRRLYAENKLKIEQDAKELKDKAKEEKNKKDFNKFLEETFVFETDAGPVSVKEFKSLATEWLKAQGRFTKLTVQQAKDMMDAKLKNKTCNLYWGVRVASDSTDINSGIPAHLTNMP